MTTHTRVKSANGRKISSTAWLSRHINDRYVQMARQQGYRSRAAFKLLEIEQQFILLGKAKIIVDLGAAPGSWSQLIRRLNQQAKVVAIDLQPMQKIPGVDFIEGDFTLKDMQQNLSKLFAGNKANVILSDMAPHSCGDRQLDHLRLVNLLEEVIAFASINLEKGGSLVAKLLRGGDDEEIISRLRTMFNKVKLFKPEASYRDSAEIYIVALQYLPK